MSVLNEVRINGVGIRSIITKNVIQGKLTLSRSRPSALDFTIADTENMQLTTEAGQVFKEGTTISWNGFAMSLVEFETGGDQVPTITVTAESDFVNTLKEQTGGKSWGDQDVSAWAKEVIRSADAQYEVQPGLGQRTIDRKEPKPEDRSPESTWDVMAEIAKQVGAWVFEYGDTIVFGKPSWLVARDQARKFDIVWDSWTKHTEALVSPPVYRWNRWENDYDGKESLTIEAADPPSGTQTLTQARPGDIVYFTGAGCPTDDPVWIITQVSHPAVSGLPVSITCWRPIDPPEVISTPAGGSGGDSAGVPTGPIGVGGWKGEQLENAAEIVKEGQRRDLPKIAMVMAIMTAMVESTLFNKDHGDDIYGVTNPDGTLTTSRGLFQQQDGWGPLSVRMQPSGAAGLFYDRLVTLDGYETASNAYEAGTYCQQVQGSAYPDKYANFYEDAKLVVDACIEAGKADAAEPLSGPLGAKVEASIAGMIGKPIDFDGAAGIQCVDVALQYIHDLFGVTGIYADGIDFYMHPGLMLHFTPVPTKDGPRRGDIVTWGVDSIYKNYIQGRYRGHVAIFLEEKNGASYYLTQNPGNAHVATLQTGGILGYMRPKGSTEEDD